MRKLFLILVLGWIQILNSTAAFIPPPGATTASVSGALLGGTNVWTGTNDFTAKPIIISQFVGLTNISQTNIDTISLVASLSGGFNGATNYGQYNFKNTARKLREHRMVTIVQAGSGLADAGLLTQIGVRLQGLIPLAMDPAPFFTPGGSAVSMAGKDTNWFTGYPMTTRNADTIDWHGQGGGGVVADVFGLCYETIPGAAGGNVSGHFKVQTNVNAVSYVDVPQFVDVNAISNRQTAKVLWWTNPAGPQNITVRVVNITADSTNVFPMLIAFDSTKTNGLLRYGITAPSADPAVQNMDLPPAAVRIPIYNAIAPDLWLENTITSLADLANVKNHYDFYKTNLPNTDILICGTYPVDPAASADANTITSNTSFYTNAVNHDFAYYDAHGIMPTQAEMARRGLTFDSIHYSATGYVVFGDVLWNWLNLPSLAQLPVSFKPQLIPGLVAMYDAAALPGFVNGTTFLRWRDVSGNGLDLVGTVGPFWTNNSGVLNGRPWVQFSALQDMHTNDATLFAQPNTFFVVTTLPSGSATYLFDSGNSAAGANRNTILMTPNNSIDQFAGIGGGISTPPIVNTNQWQAIFAYYNAASSYVTVNGLQVSTNLVTIGANGMQGVALASAFDLSSKGDPGIALWAWWNRTLATNEINQLLQYANTNYGIPIYQMASAVRPGVSFTFPATTVNWTNPIGANIDVYIDNSGVTGTAIKKNGGTLVAGVPVGYDLTLKAGEYFSETYSAGTPVGVWHPTQ